MSNYQLITDNIIAECNLVNQRPTLLLHSCCAPCSSYVLEYLSQTFDITVFYYNPNIFPYDEYLRRNTEQIELIDAINKVNAKANSLAKNNIISNVNQIKFLEGSYDYEAFNKAAYGYEDEAEGGKRCSICYDLRLKETALKAQQFGFDYFCTTLSVSPYKNVDKLNEIGTKYANIYNVKYLTSDFKKKGGFQRSIQLSKQYDLYRQDYCGCKYSRSASQTKRLQQANKVGIITTKE